MFNEIEVIGNPRLRPENTRAYDVGIVQGLPGGIFLDVSAYYKDVTDLIQTAYFFDEQQSVYRTFINRDYADIKGFHVNLEKRDGNVRGYIRYNYEAATGKASTDLAAPVAYFEQPAEGQEAVEDRLPHVDRNATMVLDALRKALEYRPRCGLGFRRLKGRFESRSIAYSDREEVDLGARRHPGSRSGFR